MVRQGTNQEREEGRESRYKGKSQLHFLWASRKTSADPKPHEVREGREALGQGRKKRCLEGKQVAQERQGKPQIGYGHTCDFGFFFESRGFQLVDPVVVANGFL